jgi:hypothetical protein
VPVTNEDGFPSSFTPGWSVGAGGSGASGDVSVIEPLDTGKVSVIDTAVRDSSAAVLARLQGGIYVTESSPISLTATNSILTAIETQITNRLGNVGQSTMAGSTPVVIASNQSKVSVTLLDSGGTALSVDAGHNLIVNILPLDSTNDSITAVVTIADGADVALGSKTQTKATDGSATSWSVVQLLKGIFDKLLGTLSITSTDTQLQASNAFSTAYEASHQVKAGAGYLWGFSVHNKNASPRYVGLYNATSKTGTPVCVWRIEANGDLPLGYADVSRYCTTGIFLQGLLDDDGTFAAASTDFWFDAQYT